MNVWLIRVPLEQYVIMNLVASLVSVLVVPVVMHIEKAAQRNYHSVAQKTNPVLDQSSVYEMSLWVAVFVSVSVATHEILKQENAGTSMNVWNSEISLLVA
jgi:hypothetical protein